MATTQERYEVARSTLCPRAEASALDFSRVGLVFLPALGGPLPTLVGVRVERGTLQN